ncbi:MAG TPA: hypothetical protein VF787_01855 [Thermoanaerobaculia bacterium]
MSLIRGEASASKEDERAISTIAALLARIDALPAGACGTFAFGGNPPASMLRVEQRRICWATSDQSSRLTDRLRRAIDAPAGALDVLFRDCRDRGIPLGQTLVDRGWISPAQFRSILVEHTAAATARIAAAGMEAVWVPSREGRHDAQFTFSTSEILAHVADSEWGPLAQLARERLSNVLQNGGRGCAYVPTCDGLLPLGLAGEELEVQEMIALGAWAERALAGAARLSDGAAFISLSSFDGDSLSAWSRDGFVYVTVCSERSDLACVLAHVREQSEESR